MKILNILKLGLTLALFAIAACVMLAFVYDVTAKKIEENRAEELNNALIELFPDADSFKEITDITSFDPAVKIESAYAALDGKPDGKIIGIALTVSRASYAGPIKTMVGVNSDGFITGVKIMEHTDTPGLGANAASDKYFVDRANGITFYGQFTNKKVTDPFIVKNDVVAITASTITSRAVSDSVKAAAHAAKSWLEAEFFERLKAALMEFEKLEAALMKEEEIQE